MSSHLEARALVIGAGVVGLAVASSLAARWRGVFVIERRGSFGRETSSRSSEVVHAGLYYRPGSAKARLCVEGARLLFEHCQRRRIPLVPRGKLVLAASRAQQEALWALRQNAEANGVEGLELWSEARLWREEPRVMAIEALHSPNTAVIDSHELIRSFAVEAREGGAELAYRHRLIALDRGADGRWQALIEDPAGDRVQLRTELIINAAGLDADLVAAMAGLDLDVAGYRHHHCKGDYFVLAGRASRGLERLLYPLPEPDLRGLGVHLTVDVAGQARLGPDTEWVERPRDEDAYQVDEAKGAVFLAAGRRLLGDLAAGDLAPERSGVRPKLGGEAFRDFVIAHEHRRGLGGLVNLVGIESPGLTAAPAIAREVVSLLERDGVLP